MTLRLHIDGTAFRDSKNREVTLHGINVAGDAKQPRDPDQSSHVSRDFFNADDVSFVGRPFSVGEAHEHFARLRRWGYNTIRYIFTWEALEHAGPGKYDDDFVQHTISVLRLAKDYGFYVFMDPHQDVWSRFSGGSGAPLWTLYACGLDPEKFLATEAALVQNTWPEPSTFPKMIWATNYTRAACQVLFTFFFAGKTFAPKAIIDGVNIQDYLQDHFINACKHLAKAIREAGDLDRDVVIGWESMNEPNRGLIGHQDLAAVPASQNMHKGTSPTPWQAILTASGRPCDIDVWDMGGFGPRKVGTKLVDPHGQSAWLSREYDDTAYGWKRSPDWKLGECIWAHHGVWDPQSDTLLKKDYFATDPATNETITYEYFTNTFFLQHYRKYKAAIRGVFPDTFMFCQGPVLEVPAAIRGTPDDDPNTVFAPHWYDGLTLINKKWNSWFNVDVFGVLRGKYSNPAFAVRIGETAIRNCFKDQLSAIRDEGMVQMGPRPCVFTEFGIPYDMSDGYAYKTGDYRDQIKAMDANHFGMEGAKAGFTLWNYTAMNDHQWGDQWNGEDLSIQSRDDPTLPRFAADTRKSSRTSLDRSSPSYSESRVSETGPDTKRNMISSSLTGMGDSCQATTGYRAAEAFVRPTPIATHGGVVSFGFNLAKCEFRLELTADSSTQDDAPTEVFLPEFHFPQDQMAVEVSGGKWSIVNSEAAGAGVQVLRWWHAEGDQTLVVKGVTRKLALASGEGEEASYLDQCKEKGCTVM